MAKQDSIIKLRGTVDDITFRRTKTGSKAQKKKQEVSALELQTSPKYARLRENMSEFNRAANAGKLLRAAVNEITANNTDKGLANRMTKTFMQVVVSDPSGKRGLRTVVDGDISLLKGFNFNPPSDLALIVKTQFQASIDRVSGKLTVNIPSFVPEDSVMAPTGASHFMFHSMGVEINFGTSLYVKTFFSSQGIKLGTDPSPVISITHDLAANSTNPLLLLLGIRFYQEVNGIFYPLRNASNNALAIVEVDTVS